MQRKIKTNFRRVLRTTKIKFQLTRNQLTKPKSTRYLSARKKAYTKFGKNFFEQFEPIIFQGRNNRKYTFTTLAPHLESEYVLGITVQTKEKMRYFSNIISRLSIGFEKEALIIEGMQTRKSYKKKLNEFRRVTKKQTLDFMLEQAEERARKLGFKQVKIRKPEFLYWFQNPVPVEDMTKKQVQRQIKILYQKIALRHNYKIEADFFVKDL